MKVNYCITLKIEVSIMPNSIKRIKCVLNDETLAFQCNSTNKMNL